MSESSGYEIPEGYLFTGEHEWVRIEEDIAIVGITDYAQLMLGELVFVELPDVGKTYKAGEDLAVAESTKAASDVYAPVTGNVIEVNNELESQPEMVNQDCYKAGWICKMKITEMGTVENLMDRRQYNDYLNGMD